MLAELATKDEESQILRASLRAALAVALKTRAPHWLIDLLAGSVGELAGLAVHEYGHETPALLDRARKGLRVWESWQRSQGIVDSF